MDSITEKSCLEEISTLVFDSLQKVTLKTISNNWQIPNDVAKDVLNKWLTQNQKKIQELVSEFIVQGVNSKGIFAISVVNEESRNKLESKWRNFNSWLYSIETKSNSRSLNLPPKFEPIEVKNIKISPGTRDLMVKPEPPVSNVDTTKIKTPFGMLKPLDKEIKKEPAEEKPKPIETKKPPPLKKQPSKEEKVKVEKTSSKEEVATTTSTPSPPSEIKASTSKGAAEKKGSSTKPIAQGKASISSFFNKSTAAAPPPSTQNAVKEAKTAEIKTEEPPKFKVKKEKEPTRKRSASPEKAMPAKKPASKKLKLKDLPNKKRARIQVIDDDSSEEEQEEQPPDEPDSKFIKFDREFTPEERMEDADNDEEEEMKSKVDVVAAAAAKNKAKRWVTKRFETEDGFIRTEKVLEEYSASEDENDENRKKNSPVQEKKTSPTAPKVTPNKKVSKTAKPKDILKGAGSGKQGSIMSFFKK